MTMADSMIAAMAAVMRCGVAGLALLMTAPAARAAQTADVALVFSVDTSGSVDGHEYELQMGGIAAAFRDPEVIAAATAGPAGRIAVTIETWGEPDYQKITSGWYFVSDAGSAETFAHVAETFEGRLGGGTGIGVGIGYAITLLKTSGIRSPRQVIDVSGDGVELGEIRDPHFTVKDAQAMRARAGVVVNGLAILTDYPDLETYYRANVAGGPGSFVMSIATFDDYAEAMRRKLLRELLPDVATLKR
jgi:hypothetical protein